MCFLGVGGGGGGREVGEIYASLVDVTWGTPFNVVCSVLPVILASRHDVDFGFLDQGNPQDGRDISYVQVD